MNTEKGDENMKLIEICDVVLFFLSRSQIALIKFWR